MHASPLLLATLFVCLDCAPSRAQQQAERQDPIAAVSEAERRCKKGEVEEGVQLLWQALAELQGQSEHPVRGAAILSANQLLTQYDPLAAARLEAFAKIAQLQVELAAAYRNKKWLDTAAQRLEIAARFDAAAVEKERAALDRALARRKPKAEPKASETPAPEVKKDPFFDRSQATRVLGTWQVLDGDRLECAAHDGGQLLYEWISNVTHEDGEFLLSLRGTAADKAFNASLSLGNAGVGNAYRISVATYPGIGQDAVRICSVKNNVFRELGGIDAPPKLDEAGCRNLLVRVRGSRVTMTLGDSPPLEIDVGEPVRGRVGLTVGMRGTPSCAVEFRGLKMGPLPADAPTDEELRAARHEALQSEVLAAVDRATALVAAKDPEAAATELRAARWRAQGMPAGILRDNLIQSIEATLQKTDPVAARRMKVAAECAAALVAVADRHAEAGRARIARALVLSAMDFDPDGQAARLQTAEADVAAWNVAQATARAAELAPPADDGTLLRAWFAEGKRLDSRQPPWVVEGPAARTDQLPGGDLTALMPKSGSPALTKARASMRLPAVGVAAGFCFDVAGPHDYAIAMLERGTKGLGMRAYRYRNGKWVQLGNKVVAVDAWRLDGWFELELEATAAGVSVRAAGAEVKLDKALFGVGAGRFGLLAFNNSREPVTIELRAFAVAP